MAKDSSGAGISLSGYLPGVEYSGMERVALQLWKAFEEARRTGDTTHETLRAVVVGVVDVKDAKVPAPGSDEDPVVNVKFARIEPVTEEGEVKVVLDLLHELAGRRKGDAPIPGLATELEPTGGQATVSAIKPGKKAAKKAAEKPVGGLKQLQGTAETAPPAEPPADQVRDGNTVPNPFTVS